MTPGGFDYHRPGSVDEALADLGKRLGFAVTVAALADDLEAFANVDHAIEGFDPAQAIRPASSFVVVASQGRRDRDALRFALATQSDYVALVASRKKAAKLMQDLRGMDLDPAAIGRIHSPAGIHIGAVTPEEIALSILAEIVQERRLAAADQAAEREPAVPGAEAVKA